LRPRNSGCSTFRAVLLAAVGWLLPFSNAWPVTRASNDLLYTTAEFLPHYRGASPPPAFEPGSRVLLPAHVRGAPLANRAVNYWFRLDFAVHPDSAEIYGVYLPYVSPDVAVYLNGAYVGASKGFGDPRVEIWNFPQLLPFSAALLASGENHLLIKIEGHGPGSVELGRLRIGPQSSLYPRYRRRMWLQVTGVEVVSLFVALIGSFTALLWWRRRSDVIFGLFSLTCALWIVRNAQFFMADTLVSPFVFGSITNGVFFWLVAVLYTLCFRILGRTFARIEAVLFGFAAAVTLALALAGPAHSGQVLAIAYIASSLPSVVFVVYLSAIALREGTMLLRLLWLAAVVSSCTGAYDLALMQEWVPWPGAYLMPYSALFYTATVGWALIDRFVKTHWQYERLNADLETRVRVREAELAAHYGRVAQLESERAIADERDRILRDMHDGLGLQLISSVRLVERGELTREQTVALLTEAMDELRIAIDSVKPTARDLLVMLGNLRYRLEPRLRSAGIELTWDIGAESRLEQLAPGQVAQITRIVQEAFSNAMKHSHANRMSLAVSGEADGTVRIVVSDNGRGFVASACAGGEGLKNMYQRAVKIGGTLRIDSKPGATTVTLTF